jgi:hypothetical protein
MPFGKWENFDACVKDFMSRGKPEENAKRICGALKARLEKESQSQVFSWESEVSPQQANLIMGKAIHPVKIIHPEEWPSARVYLEEELKKAAGSMRDTPLLLDHEQPLSGKVLDAWYTNGAVEYIAELNDPQVLSWIKDGTIRNCSVEYEWDDLEQVDGIAPRGITFTGLALLKEYEPGDQEATVQVWEAIIKRLKEANDIQANGQDAQNQNNSAIQGDLYSVILSLKEETERNLLDLQSRVSALENIVNKNTHRGEAVIEPSATHDSGLINREEVLADLKKACYERVPKHWSYGADLQNRRLKDIIRKLENQEKGEA